MHMKDFYETRDSIYCYKNTNGYENCLLRTKEMSKQETSKEV